MQYNKNKLLILLAVALLIVAMVVPAQAATWDSTMVYYATTVIKYDIAVGDKLKGAADDTVRILTVEGATPYKVYLATDRSTALPMSWVTETIYTDTYGNRGCAIGDVDNDGQNEIIIGRSSSPYQLKMIKWSGSAWVTTTIFAASASGIYDIAIGDADNNPATPNDIIFNSSYGLLKARWNGATFDSTRIFWGTSTIGSVYCVAMGDFDATYAGNEIVTATYGQFVYRIKWNGASWDSTTLYKHPTDIDLYDVTVGDFDASNPGAEIAINNGYGYATNGAILEVYGSGATWAMRNLGYNPSNWGGYGEIAVGDFYSSNPGAEIVAVSGSGSAYEARLVYGSGTTWFNEKIMGTGGLHAYGVALGNLNRYRPGTEMAVGGNYKVWEVEQKLLSLDMSAISIDGVPGMMDAGSTITVKATVKNFAEYNANFPIPVKFRIDGPSGYSYTDVDQATTINLPPAGTEQIIFSPDWTCPSTLGNYTIKAWTELAGDQIPANDTFTFVVTAIRPGGLNEQFTGTTFPPAGWTVYNFGTVPGDPWVRYTAYYRSAPACAQIYYDAPNNDWLITPRLRVVSGDIFSFWWRTHSTSYSESLLVRLSTNPNVADTGAYLVIGSVASTGNISWFNKQIDMSSYAGQDVYVAFWYQCNNNYGMGIDDVTGPYFPPQIKVTPDSVYAEGYVNSFFDVFFNVANIGGGTLNYTTTLSHPAGYLTIIPTSGSLGLGVSRNDTLRFNTTGLAGHYYDTLVVTSNSGTKATNLVPIHLYVRLVPNIAVSPDSFAVGVEANGTKDTVMFINNTGNGELNYAVQTFESGKLGAVFNSEPATGVHDIDLVNRETKPDKDWIDNRRGVPPTKGQGGPDAFGYKWKDSDAPGGPTFSWIEINALGTLVTSSDDNNSGPYPIGFPFKFYGNTFTDFRICSNGFVSFTSTVNNLTNDTIPNPPEPNNLLALFWDDLYPYSSGTGKIYYYNDGSKLIIEYDHVIRYGQTTCPYTMEAILYPNGKIVYQYLQMGDGTCTYLNQSTIGIENATGTVGLEVVFNANYIHNNMAIVFSAAPAWLIFSPETGVAPAFGTDTVDITFDATGILGGDFYGGFVVTSDDPDTPVDTVPAHMTVLAPNMTFTPDSIMTTATEGQAPFDVTMDVGNSGNGKLIYSITEGMPWLSVAPVSDTVLVGDPASTVTLTINAGSLYAGHYHGELKVYSNDPDLQPYATYQVYLSVGPYPDITVTPDSFYVGIYAGYTKDTVLTIGNIGDGHLAWGIAIEELGKAGDTTLYEGFEGTFPPTGWTVVNNDGGTMQWEQSTLYYHTGTKSANCRWETTTLWNDDWLITPKISIGSNDSLSFWQRVYTASNPESLEVRLSTTTNDVSAFTTLLWAGSQLTNTTWEERKIELAKFSKGQVYIAFVYKGLYQWRIYVDDVTVRSYAGPWLTVNPLSGVNNPHTSKNVAVHFSSAGIENDMYANLWITSNDPDESPVLVPVHMALLGPNYSVSPPETLVINALENQLTDGHVFLYNTGGHAPLAYKITDPVAWLSESPDTAEVPINGSQDVTVTVNGNLLIAGDYATKLFIKTNYFSMPNDTLVVIVHMGPSPDISVSPESLRVSVPAGGTHDELLTVNNDGDGHLAFDISTEETGPKMVSVLKDRFPEILKSHAASIMQNSVPIDENSPAQLTAGKTGDKQLSAPGAPIKAGGDTVFVQWPHDPTDTWSMGTSDAGALYKVYENFWGVTKPINGIEWWGLCLKYSGGWVAGNPANLVFNVIFYSDPANDPTMPPNQVACSFTNVVPTEIINTGQLYSGYTLYKFRGLEIDPVCNLPEGWVSIQSQSAGSGYDWFLWASAKTGDAFSYQEGSSTPSTVYDRAVLMTGGQPWFSVAPEADTVNPHSSTNVTVHFDATNVMGGDKYGNIIIGSNDPDENPLLVPVHMIIAGAQYAIHPGELHINVNEGNAVTEHLTVLNPGGLGPLSYRMTWVAPWLNVNPDTADILPDLTQDVLVRVDALNLIAGDYYAEILLRCNAANQQRDTIPVYVHVGPDPDIDVAPMNVKALVNPGCNKEEILRVNNVGLGHLSFETSIEASGPKFVSVMTQQQRDLNRVFGRDRQPNVTLPPAGTLIGKNGSVAPQMTAPSLSPGDNFNNLPENKDVLLSEGFEGSWLPAGWTMIQNNTGYQGTNPCFWSQMSNYAHSGTYSAGLWWDYYYQDEWLITPSMTIAGSCTLSFWTYGYLGSTYGDHYYVMVTTNNGANWTPVFDLSALTGGWNYYASPFYVDLSAYSGQTVKLAWYAQDPTTNDGMWYAWLIDDISVWSSKPPCAFTVSPEADTIPNGFEDLIVTFDGAAFEACAEETLCCNLVFTTNDPDEPTVTVPICAWSARGNVFEDPKFQPTCVIDLGDVVYLINYVFKNGPAPSPVCLGDVAPTHDGMVDNEDVMYLLQYLYGGGAPPLATPQIRQPGDIQQR